jgi:hypothetical protein
VSDSTKRTRRDVLKGLAASTAGAALVGGLNLSRTAHAAGSDQMKVALIGCGGRGGGAANDCLTANENVKIVAVADAFEDRAAGAADRLMKSFPRDRVDIPADRVFVGLDAYKKAIDSGVDMVVMATPPGFRPAQYNYAIAQGKHVFMEKPCCTDAAGYRLLVETNKMADEKGLKVGVGLQRHHQSGYIGGVQEIQDGKLGDLLFLRVYWNGGDIWLRGRREGMTEMEYQVYNWYHFTWAGGDNICEQHVHNIDVANWVMNDHPVEANGMGGCQVRGKPAESEIFDHHFVEFTYASGVKMFSQCRQQNNTWSSVSEFATGTKGTSGVSGGNGPQLKFGNPYQQEHADLMQAILSGEKYNEGWYGATSSMTAVLGRMATYSGKVVKWDEAVAKGPDLQPERLAWDAPPRDLKDSEGKYPIPMPGQYEAY